MDEHTPLPWRLLKNGLADYRILAEQGPITVCPATVHCEPDAAYIVQACNAYPELVAALELARDYVETAADDGLDVCVDDLAKIDAALALANSVSGGSKASDVSEPVNIWKSAEEAHLARGRK